MSELIDKDSMVGTVNPRIRLVPKDPAKLKEYMKPYQQAFQKKRYGELKILKLQEVCDDLIISLEKLEPRHLMNMNRSLQLKMRSVQESLKELLDGNLPEPSAPGNES
jgi:hypothetical protein